MPSTFFGLTIGTSGLYAYQTALNTTSHNISNADTKGYSRQIAKQAASQAISVSSKFGMAGTGVDVNSIEQERNVYYDMKYWSNNSIYGEYQSKEYYLTAIEDYFKENNADGLTTAFDDFYNSLTNLTKDVGNGTIRTQITNSASSFSKFVNYLSTSLQRIQEECNSEIKTTVDRVNSIAEQIAAVNKQINTIEVTGMNANDLRDKRALLVDELSTIANITVEENKVEDGIGISEYTVRIDGKVLVDTYNYNTLECIPKDTKNTQNDIKGLYDIQWSNGQEFNSHSPTLGGSLQAQIEVRDGNNLEAFKGTATGTSGTSTITISDASINDMSKLNIPASDGVIKVGSSLYEYSSFTATQDPTTKKWEYTFTLKNALSSNVSGSATIGKNVDYKGIPYYESQLNEFVRTFASRFNQLHNEGYDLDGNKGLDFFNGTNPVTGANFNLNENATTINGADDTYYQITAANFCVTEDILSDPNKIACASKQNGGIEDKVYLDKLIALKTDVSVFKQGTPSAFLQTLTAEIGIDTKTAQTFTKSQNNILKAIDAQRMSVSGVDSDEEAMNLVKFQNAYNLSAKVIQVMDEIYDKLINQMGV